MGEEKEENEEKEEKKQEKMQEEERKKKKNRRRRRKRRKIRKKEDLFATVLRELQAAEPDCVEQASYKPVLSFTVMQGQSTDVHGIFSRRSKTNLCSAVLRLSCTTPLCMPRSVVRCNRRRQPWMR